MCIINEIKNINTNCMLCENLELIKLAKKHTDPYSFAKNAIAMMRSGQIKLKVRGAANTRELVIAWYRINKK